MEKIFKKSSLKTILVISVFLIITLFLMKMGINNKKETVLAHNNDNIQIFIGNVDVEGEGVSVTLKDRESNEINNNNIIHDIDLIEVVNLLNSAGAEVISINDERLLLTSKIEANKMTIKINDTEYTSPFNIKAIGDSEILSNALTNETSYLNLLKEHVEIEIEKHNKLYIPKYKGNIYFKYAKPVYDKID